MVLSSQKHPITYICLTTAQPVFAPRLLSYSLIFLGIWLAFKCGRTNHIRWHQTRHDASTSLSFTTSAALVGFDIRSKIFLETDRLRKKASPCSHGPDSKKKKVISYLNLELLYTRD